MHEGALVYRILGEIKPQMPPGSRLKAVSIEVGEFSCVNPRSLTQAFDIAKKDTFANMCRLKFSVVRGGEDIIIRTIEVRK
jgi:Zn finger protein HypA/HybF involved in hydrogenase expression